MTEEIGFSKYGKGFQESLAQLILDDRPFADQMEEVMDVNFFEFKYLRTFINLIYNYRQRYDVHPSKKIMSTVLRADLDDENDTICKQVRDYFSRICFRELSDIEYVKQTSLDFCKKQKLKEAMIKSVDLLQASSYDEIESIITKALRLGTDGNYGHDYKKDF